MLPSCSPSLNFTPWTTWANSACPFNVRHFCSAVFVNLKVIASRPARETQPRVLLVLSRTVANVDSIAFVVRMCSQSSAENHKTSASCRDPSPDTRSLSDTSLRTSIRKDQKPLGIHATLGHPDLIQAFLGLAVLQQGSLLRTFAVLCTHQRCALVVPIVAVVLSETECAITDRQLRVDRQAALF